MVSRIYGCTGFDEHPGGFRLMWQRSGHDTKVTNKEDE